MIPPPPRARRRFNPFDSTSRTLGNPFQPGSNANPPAAE
jgi:hypothetical protein